jgi:HD-GYP domain-containing protein (c-di-GMP phosphodiesterase class II)
VARPKDHYFQNQYEIRNNERCKRVLSAVHMVYRLVNSTYNVKELSLRLTRLLCQFIRGRSARVILLDPDKKKIVLVAIFDNKINILLDKKKDLNKIPQKEINVTEGYAIQEKRLLGLPMVADENIGAIFIRRGGNEPCFTEFDRAMLSVFAEQSVTAIKNLQLYEQQQKIILGSIKLIDKLLEKQGRRTGPHTPVYFYIAKSIAEMLNIGQEGIDCLYYASVLHDAGAIDVPYEILSKTSQLTPEEFNVIRELPNKSAELIRPVDFLGPVLPMVLYHHEKYDGTGYPSGLKKEQIPIGARIMGVVDAFEAMVCGRPYRKKLSVTTAVREIQLHSGTQFDPKVVNVFTELYKQKKFRDYLSSIKR